MAQFFLGCALYSGSYIAQGAVHHVEENRKLGLSYIRKSAAHDEERQRKASRPRRHGLKKTASRNTLRVEAARSDRENWRARRRRGLKPVKCS